MVAPLRGATLMIASQTFVSFSTSFQRAATTSSAVAVSAHSTTSAAIRHLYGLWLFSSFVLHALSMCSCQLWRWSCRCCCCCCGCSCCCHWCLENLSLLLLMRLLLLRLLLLKVQTLHLWCSRRCVPRLCRRRITADLQRSSSCDWCGFHQIPHHRASSVRCDATSAAPLLLPTGTTSARGCHHATKFDPAFQLKVVLDSVHLHSSRGFMPQDNSSSGGNCTMIVPLTSKTCRRS